MRATAARRRLECAGPARDRMRARLRPSAAELHDASYLVASATEPRSGVRACERNGKCDSSTAVSLRVEPHLVLTLIGALVRARGMKAAFVYGSAAKAQYGPQSDVNLMVIGDVTYADCFAGLLNAEKLLKRRIHAKF